MCFLGAVPVSICFSEGSQQILLRIRVCSPGEHVTPTTKMVPRGDEESDISFPFAEATPDRLGA